MTRNEKPNKASEIRAVQNHREAEVWKTGLESYTVPIETNVGKDSGSKAPAWEPAAFLALPAKFEAEPRYHCVPRQELGNETKCAPHPDPLPEAGEGTSLLGINKYE